MPQHDGHVLSLGLHYLISISVKVLFIDDSLMTCKIVLVLSPAAFIRELTSFTMSFLVLIACCQSFYCTTNFVNGTFSVTSCRVVPIYFDSGKYNMHKGTCFNIGQMVHVQIKHVLCMVQLLFHFGWLLLSDSNTMDLLLPLPNHNSAEGNTASIPMGTGNLILIQHKRFSEKSI